MIDKVVSRMRFSHTNFFFDKTSNLNGKYIIDSATGRFSGIKFVFRRFQTFVNNFMFILGINYCDLSKLCKRHF